MIKRRRLKFFGHSIRRDGLEKTIIDGFMKGKISRGCLPIRFIDYMQDTTNLPLWQLLEVAYDRDDGNQLDCVPNLVAASEYR